MLVISIEILLLILVTSSRGCYWWRTIHHGEREPSTTTLHAAVALEVALGPMVILHSFYCESMLLYLLHTLWEHFIRTTGSCEWVQKCKGWHLVHICYLTWSLIISHSKKQGIQYLSRTYIFNEKKKTVKKVRHNDEQLYSSESLFNEPWNNTENMFIVSEVKTDKPGSSLTGKNKKLKYNPHSTHTHTRTRTHTQMALAGTLFTFESELVLVCGLLKTKNIQQIVMCN